MQKTKTVQKTVAKNVEAKTEEKTEAKKVEAKVEVKKSKKTVASVIVEILLNAKKQGKKIESRKVLAEKVVKIFDTKYEGQHKGGQVRQERVVQQIGALFKCFNNWDNQGNPRKGWWETYKVDETDGIEITIVKQ